MRGRHPRATETLIGPTAVHRGRLHGLRRWELSRDATGAVRLGAGLSRWCTDGETTWARCTRGYTWDSYSGWRPLHEASTPAPGCTCGLYAVHPCAALDSSFWAHQAEDQRMLAFGVVEAWGRVQLYREGFRARFARPLALALIGAPRRSDYGRLLEDVAIAHRAELIEVRDDAELVEHCRGAHIGLAASKLSSLLDPAAGG